MDEREIQAVILFEGPSGVIATYHDVPLDCAVFDLACLWLGVVQRAERLNSIGTLAINDHERGRSVVLCHPPITRAERERSDYAHADTIEDAIRMLKL